MSGSARRFVIGVLSALAMVVGGVGLAWACTPQAYLFLSETGGSPGTTITVTGKEFAPGPVEIEWTGAPGAETAIANGPSFSVAMTVPDVEPGVLYVQATAVDDFGGIEGQATRAFKVNVPAAERAPARTVASPEPRSEGAPTPAGGAEPQSRQSPGGDAGPARAGAPDEPAAKPAASVPATPAAGKRGRAADPSPETPARSPSQGTVAADLWSGFASGPNASLLPGPADSAVSTSGSGSGLALGMALLGAGLTALLGGFAIAGLRRRRTSAQR